MPETPNDSNPTLSPKDVAEVHDLAAARRQSRERERQLRAASDQVSSKQQAKRRLLASLEGADEESTAAATVARQKAAEKAKADLAAHNRAAEAAKVVATKAAQAAIVKAETDRVVALVGLSKYAAKLGVSFDLAGAISGRVTAKAVHAAINNAAAEADEAEENQMNCFCGPSASEVAQYDRGGRDNDGMAVGWNRALEKAASRAGLPSFPLHAHGGSAKNEGL